MKIIKYFLLFFIWCGVGSAQTEEPQDRLIKVIRGVIRSEIPLTPKVHEQFWSDFRILSKNYGGDKKETFEVLSKLIITAHSYQIAFWESALQSFRKREIFRSDEMKTLEKAITSQPLEILSIDITDEKNKEIFKAFDAINKKSIRNANMILEAAANHTTLQLPGQGDIEMSEAVILAISASLNGSFNKIQRLINPVWTDDILSSASSVALTRLDKGLAAYKQADFATAFRELKPLAIQGNVASQLALGAMYANGQGVLQDYKESVKWYALAAAQNEKKFLSSDVINKQATNVDVQVSKEGQDKRNSDFYKSLAAEGVPGPAPIASTTPVSGTQSAPGSLNAAIDAQLAAGLSEFGGRQARGDIPALQAAGFDATVRAETEPTVFEMFGAAVAGASSSRLFNGLSDVVRHVFQERSIDVIDPNFRIPEADMLAARSEDDLQDLREVRNAEDYARYKQEKSDEEFRQKTIFSRGTATGVMMIFAAAILDPVNVILFVLAFLFFRKRFRRRNQQD